MRKFQFLIGISFTTDFITSFFKILPQTFIFYRISFKKVGQSLFKNPLKSRIFSVSHFDLEVDPLFYLAIGVFLLHFPTSYD